MKILSIAIYLVCFISITDGYSQAVDYPKNIEWNKAGAVTEFPEISEADSIFYVPPPDSASDWKNIQAAIDAAGSAAGINLVLIPEGNYNLNQPLVLKAGKHDNVYIKGAGPNHLMNSGPATTLSFDFSNPIDFRIPVYGNINAGIAFKGGNDIFLGAISGYDPSTNQVSITGSSNDLSAGDIIRVRSNKSGVSCKEHPCMGQINRVKKVLNLSPLVLKLEHSFSLTWDQQEEYGGLNLDVHKIDALQNVGISSLGMETIGYKPDPLPDHFACKDEPKAANSPHGHHILAFRAYNVLIKDLYSHSPIASHIYMLESLHNKISESFFDNVIYSHGCNGGHGYGVNLWRKNTLNLIENNIFRHLRRSIIISRGAHKNVIAYNYTREIWRQTGNPDQGAGLGNRNMFESGNLSEGNRVSRIWNDVYHGKEYTSYKEVFFRNFTTLNSIENEGGIESYFLGNQGVITGENQSSIKTDIYGFSQSTLLTHTLASTDYSAPDVYLNITSLYHNETPHFFLQKDRWNRNYSWPPFGPRLTKDGQQLIQDIPARGRYCDAYDDFQDSAYHCMDSGASLESPGHESVEE